MNRDINIRQNLKHENITQDKDECSVLIKSILIITKPTVMCIPCAWHCVKLFTLIISFKYSKRVMLASLLSSSL